MPRAKAPCSTGSTRRIRPAMTPEAREAQLVSLAYDLVEKRLLEGTASSQETTHFLKLASSRYRCEQELMQEEIALKRAKTEAIESAKQSDAMYAEVLEALRAYNGQGESDEGY